MLDNMDLDEIRRCVAINDGRAQLEVSGGVTIERIAALAATGVDRISCGALTHSAPAADLHMKW
jgi:nicotinate-nucleotide pyrophosphorylase (carboxylating)